VPTGVGRTKIRPPSVAARKSAAAQSGGVAPTAAGNPSRPTTEALSALHPCPAFLECARLENVHDVYPGTDGRDELFDYLKVDR